MFIRMKQMCMLQIIDSMEKLRFMNYKAALSSRSSCQTFYIVAPPRMISHVGIFTLLEKRFTHSSFHMKPLVQKKF